MERKPRFRSEADSVLLGGKSLDEFFLEEAADRSLAELHCEKDTVELRVRERSGLGDERGFESKLENACAEDPSSRQQTRARDGSNLVRRNVNCRSKEAPDHYALILYHH